MVTSWQRLNRQITACERCPRLREHCRQVAQVRRKAYADWEYWGKPVENFGDSAAALLIVGLAPAAHGANRTGRMFTGDRSGDWLYRALYKAGFANQALATDLDDGLTLSGCAITAVCHCAPPDNKPTREERANCLPWLSESIDLVDAQVFLALGQIAFNAVIDEAKRRGWWEGARPKFSHACQFELGEGRLLVGSYHPSQQNTFTGRLTEPMLDAVFSAARQYIERERKPPEALAQQASKTKRKRAGRGRSS